VQGGSGPGPGGPGPGGSVAPDGLVHTWHALRGQALLVGDAAEQAQQLAALGVGQRGAELLLVSADHLLGPAEHVPALIGQVQGMRTPVRGITPALDKPALLELVHQENHARGVQPEQLAESLLRLALVSREPGEHPGVTLLKAEGLEQLPEHASRVVPQLDKEQAEAPVIVGTRRLGLTGHSDTLSNDKTLAVRYYRD